MKYLVIVILLLSCSKSVLTVSEPVADVPVVVSQDKPIFKLGMPFEGGSMVKPVMSMPVWTPVVCTTFNSYVPSKKEVASCVKTILGVDTVTISGEVVHDTVYVQKIVHSRFLAYLMFVVGFVVGALTLTALILMQLPRKPKSDKSGLSKRDVSQQIMNLRTGEIASLITDVRIK